MGQCPSCYAVILPTKGIFISLPNGINRVQSANAIHLSSNSQFYLTLSYSLYIIMLGKEKA